MVINHSVLRKILVGAGVELGDCITAFAADETSPYVRIARAQQETGRIEVGEPTFISETPDGAYVLAWMWVPKPEQADGDSLTMPLDLGTPG